MIRSTIVRLLALGAVAAVPTALPAQDPGADAPVAHATRIHDDPPVIDGHLDEAAWAAATPITGFTQRAPAPGEPASERTEVRIVYDDHALYVGMRMFDEHPDSIATQLGRRDLPRGYSDWVHVILDSYHDRRTAFRFGVNPSGVKKDVLHYDDTREDVGWDAVWEVATHTDSLGWTAEFRIPFSQLRFSTGDAAEGLAWGVNFWREIARRSEHSYWAPVPPNLQRFVSVFGELRGLEGLSSPRRIEILPYSVGRMRRAPGDPSNPFYSETDLYGTVGADLKFGVTSDLTLTATINPDFGQVEADPSQVNLSAFEQFFPERRPFFTEGVEIFQMRISPGDGGAESLFYSRRIGRSPQRSPFVRDGYVHVPEAARILGAGKLSGKTAGGWTVGALTAVTAETEARVASPDGVIHREPVEPLTHYGVGRLGRDFNDGRSAVRGIFTGTNRRLNDDRLEFLPSAAYSGGVDARHRFTGGRYQVSGWLLGSHVQGSEQAITRLQHSPTRLWQRPDAEHVQLDPTRTSLTGWAANGEFIHTGDGRWIWGLVSGARSPEFEVNDLGFQQFADMWFAGGFLNYNQFQPGERFRRWGVNSGFFPAWTFGGERVQTQVNLGVNGELRNFWGGGVGLNRDFGGLSTFDLRGGPAVVKPAQTMFWANMYTDSRKPVRGTLNLNGHVQSETGSRRLTVGPGVTVRPATNVELSVSPSFTWNGDAWQYVQTVRTDDGPEYIFGRIDQSTVSLTTRLNYTFTPNLSVELYARPFLSGGGYSDFRYVADPRAPHFDDRAPRFGPEELVYDEGARRYGVHRTGEGEADFFFRDPDFNVRRFESNAVLRWEYRPGSTVFLVWNQGRRADVAGEPHHFGRDMGELFAAPPANTLLLKVTYWLDT